EDALDADAVGHLPDREHLPVAAAAARDDRALEDLDALLVALDDPDVNAHGIAGLELRQPLAELLRLDAIDRVHGRNRYFYPSPRRRSRMMAAALLTDMWFHPSVPRTGSRMSSTRPRTSSVRPQPVPKTRSVGRRSSASRRRRAANPSRRSPSRAEVATSDGSTPVSCSMSATTASRSCARRASASASFRVWLYAAPGPVS